jgi:hypothetical protein
MNDNAPLGPGLYTAPPLSDAAKRMLLDLAMIAIFLWALALAAPLLSPLSWHTGWPDGGAIPKQNGRALLNFSYGSVFSMFAGRFFWQRDRQDVQ